MLSKAVNLNLPILLHDKNRFSWFDLFVQTNVCFFLAGTYGERHETIWMYLSNLLTSLLFAQIKLHIKTLARVSVVSYHLVT